MCCITKVYKRARSGCACCGHEPIPAIASTLGVLATFTESDEKLAKLREQTDLEAAAIRKTAEQHRADEEARLSLEGTAARHAEETLQHAIAATRAEAQNRIEWAWQLACSDLPHPGDMRAVSAWLVEATESSPEPNVQSYTLAQDWRQVHRALACAAALRRHAAALRDQGDFAAAAARSRSQNAAVALAHARIDVLTTWALQHAPELRVEVKGGAHELRLSQLAPALKPQLPATPGDDAASMPLVGVGRQHRDDWLSADAHPGAAGVAHGMIWAVWSGLGVKAGRMRVVEWHDGAIGLDVPKGLASMDVAFRVLVMRDAAKLVGHIERWALEAERTAGRGGARAAAAQGGARPDGTARNAAHAVGAMSNALGGLGDLGGPVASSCSSSSSASSVRSGKDAELDDEEPGAAQPAGAAAASEEQEELLEDKLARVEKEACAAAAAEIAAAKAYLPERADLVAPADVDSGDEEDSTAVHSLLPSHELPPGVVARNLGEESQLLAARDRATKQQQHATPAWRAVGGVIWVEMLTLPPADKQIKSWHLSNASALHRTVERRAHPLEGQGAAAQAQALRVRTALPDTLVLPEELKVAYWDGDLEAWEVDEDAEPNILDISGKATPAAESGRILVFKTTWLRGLALVAPVTQDVPFTSWSMAPAQSAKSLLARIAATVPEHWCVPTGDDAHGSVLPVPGAVSIAGVATPRFILAWYITEHGIALASPAPPQLHHLVHRTARPGQLLSELASCGVDVRPRGSWASALPDGWSCKARTVEQAACFDMARTCNVLTWGRSAWNQTAPGAAGVRSVAVLRCRETRDEFGPGPQAGASAEHPLTGGAAHPADWRHVQYEYDCTARHQVKSRLVHGALEPSAAGAGWPTITTDAHHDVVTALAPRLSEESVELMADAPPAAVDTAFQLLKLLRPLSFA